MYFTDTICLFLVISLSSANATYALFLKASTAPDFE